MNMYTTYLTVHLWYCLFYHKRGEHLPKCALVFFVRPIIIFVNLAKKSRVLLNSLRVYVYSPYHVAKCYH